MFESSMFNFLWEVAPVIGIMGIVIFFMYKELKEERNNNREREKDNLETLKDLKNLLDGFFSKIDRNKEEIVDKVTTEANNTRKQVENNIKILEANIRNRNGS